MRSSRPPTYQVSPTGLMEIGSVTRPHGIQGEIRVLIPLEYASAMQAVQQVYLDLPESRQPPDPRAYRVEAARFHQDVLLLKLKGVSTRDEAELLRGAVVSVRVQDLPALDEGAYYIHELIGLRVVTLDGQPLGELVEVLVTGANDVYVVQGASGQVLLPAIESVVKAVDLGSGTITVAVPEGLT